MLRMVRNIINVDFSRGRIWVHMINLCVSMIIFVCGYGFSSSIGKSIQTAIDKFGTNVVAIKNTSMPFYTSDMENSILDWSQYNNLNDRLSVTYDIAPVLQYGASVSDGADIHTYLNIWATTPNFFRLSRTAIIKGRAFTAIESENGLTDCVVSSGLENDDFRINIGSVLSVGNDECRVVGISSSESSIPNYSNSRTIFISIENLKSFSLSTHRPLTQIFLRKRNGDLETDIRSSVLTSMRLKQDESKIEVWSATKFWESRTAIVNSLSILILAIASVIVALAAISLANSLLLDVTLRRGEIGLRIALGATRLDIFKMIIFEGVAIVVCGGGAGILFGLAALYVAISPLAARGLIYDERVYVGIDLYGIVLCLATLLVTAVGASFVPARMAAKIEPSVALRDL
jgi:ABC-type antimicrobial peptide transport system permease subunit